MAKETNQKTNIESDPLQYSIDEELMKRICEALETGRENALECLNNHVNSLNESQPVSLKDRRLSRLWSEDIGAADWVLSDLKAMFSEG